MNERTIDDLDAVVKTTISKSTEADVIELSGSTPFLLKKRFRFQTS